MNALNLLPAQDIYKVRVGTMDAVVNSRMYLRRDYPVSTLNYRKGWARRKHSNDLLFLSNVMTVWAKEYRFYRNYNRSLFYQNFFANTYLSFNLHIAKRVTTQYTRANVAVVGAGWTSSLSTYFKDRGATWRSNSFLFLRGFNWAYASFSKPYNRANADSYSPGLYVPLLSPGFGETSPLTFPNQVKYSPLNILSLTQNLHWGWVTALYGVLVKLFFFRAI